jgi:Zn-dependent protease/predicted transcriptional regulator
VSYFPLVLPGISGGLVAVITIVTVILFFSSVLIHEMCHSVVAKKKGIPVEKITLFMFGGVAEIEKEPDNPSSEFIIAIAGPASSFILAGIFGIIWYFSRGFALVMEPAKYLTFINLMLGMFNILPGYPLDGGRILRSIVWKVTGNLKRATFIASTVGRVLGFMIITFGIVLIFFGDFINGMWLAFIGWFLQSSAQASYTQLVLETSIKGIKVRDIMNKDIVDVTRDTTLQDLVDDYFMKYRFGRFPVIENLKTKKLMGIISIHDVKSIPREEWPNTYVGSIVKKVTEEEKVDGAIEMSEAIKRMTKNNLSHLVVMFGDRLEGIITKSDIMNFLKVQSELRQSV